MIKIKKTTQNSLIKKKKEKGSVNCEPDDRRLRNCEDNCTKQSDDEKAEN